MRAILMTQLTIGLGLGVLLGACEIPRVSPEHGLPPLVTISGKAEIPDDYLVMSGVLPAPRGFRTSLSTIEGALLANGTIVSETGEFTISVPQSSLKEGPAVYEVTLRNGQGAAVYSAPAQVHSQGSLAPVTISATSTAVWLGAKAAVQMGKPIQGWDFAAISRDASVLSLANRIARDTAERSNDEPGRTLLSTVPLPAEVQSGVLEVMAAAERLSR